MSKKILLGLLIFIFFLGVDTNECAIAQIVSDQVFSKISQPSLIQDQINSHGKAPVIIKLAISTSIDGTLSETNRKNQRQQINNAQNKVLDLLEDLDVSNLKRFRTIPYLSFSGNSNAINRLANSNLVEKIYPDEISEPILAETVDQIGASEVWSAGYTGNGQTVVILDSGFDLDHDLLANKIVDEACFSTTNEISTTLCPNGEESSTAIGSSNNCDLSISGCSHGSHVAGIAAGNNGSLFGVAKDANLITIQVFSRFEANSDYCDSSPCTLAWHSDLIVAMEHVYLNLSDTYNIASLNMSLGGGQYNELCDDDIRAPIINNLRAINIATIVSSGNDGYTNSISAPACISSAISVGAVNKSDGIASFSNSVSFLDLLAPGVSVYSSVPNNAYAYFSGTSMAAPHVAGTWAIIKEMNPDASVSQVLAVLQNNGFSITDSRNSITFPRIDIGSLRPVPVSYRSDWSLAGIPIITSENFDYQLWFQNSSDEPFEFTNSYQSVSDLHPGNGYWMPMNDSEEVIFIGEPVKSMTLELNENWNLVSGIGSSLDVSSIADSEGILTSDWYGFDGAYSSVSFLEAGQGYWVKTSQAGNITLEKQAGKQSTAPPIATYRPAEEFNSLYFFTETNDTLQTLYFGNELPNNIEQNRYIMPPIPPKGSFDARFSDMDTRLTESDNPDIHLQLPEKGHIHVALHSSGLNQSKQWKLVQLIDGVPYREDELTSDASIEIYSPEVNKLQLQSVGSHVPDANEQPVRYTLEQNYPNPFNPTTTIRFSLPQQSRVEIAVYNIVGRQVGRVVNQLMEAGIHTAIFDASSLTSGVYFYEMQAGSFREIKKLTVIK